MTLFEISPSLLSISCTLIHEVGKLVCSDSTSSSVFDTNRRFGPLKNSEIGG